MTIIFNLKDYISMVSEEDLSFIQREIFKNIESKCKYELEERDLAFKLIIDDSINVIDYDDPHNNAIMTNYHKDALLNDINIIENSLFYYRTLISEACAS